MSHGVADTDTLSPRRVAARALGVALAACALLTWSLPADAQHFGRNKVQYDTFDFRVLETEHFDIYYYPEEAEAARQVGRMAERWRTRLGTLLNHALTGRQAVVLYASHPQFEQTNVIEGMIGESVGGVTEGGQRRVVLPMGASLGETDHVLGHELVHAFQFDILGLTQSYIPLWVIEGMAEYLSIGARHPQTAMWLRDAAIEDRLPDLEDLDNPRFFPYRFGHAFWAYVAGRWGDGAVGQILKSMARSGETAGIGYLDAIELVTGTDRETLATEWHDAIRQAYDITPGSRPELTEGRQLIIGERTGSGRINIGPALSPDGRRVAYLSERSRLSIDLYLADAETGEVIRQLTSTAADPHFDSLQFLASAGAWDPTGQTLVVATVRKGRPALAFFDADRGDRTNEIPFPELGEIFQPAWSPDGRAIAFAAQVGGFTDLYVYDLEAGTTRQLTDDPFADLQPAWSPDGQRIAFVTERFSTDLGSLAIGAYDLAMVAAGGGDVSRVETGLDGQVISPQWSADGDTLFFVSNAAGRANAYRLAPGGTPTRITASPTGIAGITPTSPALSMAANVNKAAVSVFHDAGYEIQIIDPTASAAALVGLGTGPDLGDLPPLDRAAGPVTTLLGQPATGLPSPEDSEAFEEEEYKAGLELVGIGNQIGVSTGGAFGTYLNGGIAMQFSDVLGNHVVGVSASVNGDFKDIGAGVSYLNRSRRWNWGAFAERAPFVSGSAATGFVDIDGDTLFLEEVRLSRQTYQQAGLVTAYPFSRSLRVEFSGMLQHIGFDREVRQRFFDPVTGVFLGERVEDLPSAESLTMGAFGAALVRDTSVFGAVGPVLGQRFRLEAEPTIGDLSLTTLSTDFRQYYMPFRPVTLAGRALHFGRYGSSSQDTRLVPLFLGYSTLVRGYGAGSFEASECTPTPDGSCPEFDQLIGSRILVFNGEVRAPAVGLFTGDLDYGPVPVELFGFADAGVAWTADERPVFADGPREWIVSVGAGARVNLMGFAIGEFNIVRPIDRPSKGWTFVFNLRPAF
jgi:Tol biopolymer transport system component